MRATPRNASFWWLKPPNDHGSIGRNFDDLNRQGDLWHWPIIAGSAPLLWDIFPMRPVFQGEGDPVRS